jgi:SAM-dependent methyltransferase
MVKGINLGSGDSWNLTGWRGIDKICGDFLNAETILPFADNSVENAYSSHFFEHVDDETSLHLFEETYRVLKPGGIFRIVVPDFEFFIRKYRLNDEKWFRSIRGARPEWAKYDVPDTISSLLLHWVANYDYQGPKGFYRGPPMGIPEQEVKLKATFGIKAFCEWAQGLVPKDDPKVTTQHINWWNFDKFSTLLTKAGFVDIHESQYQRSNSKTMLESGMFDSWKPNRQPFSLYVEITK